MGYELTRRTRESEVQKKVKMNKDNQKEMGDLQSEGNLLVESAAVMCVEEEELTPQQENRAKKPTSYKNRGQVQ